MSATPTTAPAGPFIPSELYFITTPQDINWEKKSKHREVETYGSNSPYISYGNTGLRKLKLNDCLIEGFSDGKQIEDNVLALEACQLMVISPDGYTSPYCWNVYAGNKSYGTFVITNISIKETMRDMSGKATRAFADISLTEVSPSQVASGADITATAVTGAIDPKFQSDLVAQDRAISAARANASGNGADGTTDGGTTNPSGSGLPNNGGPNALEQAAQQQTGLTPEQQRELLNPTN